MFSNFNKFKYFLKNKQRGMTLVELLVVISIFTVISSIVMFDYTGFRSTTSTQNLTNDIALSIRKVQSSAIGVRAVNSLFSYGYGIHFTTNTNITNKISGSDKSFVLFADVLNNRKYDYDTSGKCGSPTSSDECEEIITIKGVERISAIYVNDTITSGGILDIVFKRPDPDAKFCYRKTISDSCEKNISSVGVEITNSQDPKSIITRKITVWNTGQISVK